MKHLILSSLAVFSVAGLTLAADIPPRILAQHQMEDAKTTAFYSPEIQTFLQGKPTWQQIQAKVEEKAKADAPAVAEVAKNPFERLTEMDRNTYRLAQENASKSPEIKSLREAVQLIQSSIDKITERITPGFAEVKQKLQH